MSAQISPQGSVFALRSASGSCQEQPLITSLPGVVSPHSAGSMGAEAFTADAAAAFNKSIDVIASETGLHQGKVTQSLVLLHATRCIGGSRCRVTSIFLAICAPTRRASAVYTTVVKKACTDTDQCVQIMYSVLAAT